MRPRDTILLALISPALASAQLIDKSAQGGRPEDKSPSVVISVLSEKHTEQPIGPDALIHLSEKFGDFSLRPYSDFLHPEDYAYAPKKQYVAYLDLIEVLSPSDENSGARRKAEISFGLKRPWYRLGTSTRCVGTIDFRLAQSIAGCDNSLLFAIGYDIRKDFQEGTFDAVISLVKIGFAVTVPIWPR